MEYQNQDFDVNRPVQCQEISREMGKFYGDIFRPICLPYRDKNKIFRKLHYKE